MFLIKKIIYFCQYQQMIKPYKVVEPAYLRW